MVLLVPQVHLQKEVGAVRMGSLAVYSTEVGMGRLDWGDGRTCCVGKLSRGEQGEERCGEAMERAHSEGKGILIVLLDFLHLRWHELWHVSHARTKECGTRPLHGIEVFLLGFTYNHKSLFV